MNEDQKEATSRRALMRRGIGLGMGVLFVAVAGRARCETKKISQEAIGYVANGKTPGEVCASCRYYIPAGSVQESASCLLVDGPINPRGHCHEYTPAAVN